MMLQPPWKHLLLQVLALVTNASAGQINEGIQCFTSYGSKKPASVPTSTVVKTVTNTRTVKTTVTPEKTVTPRPVTQVKLTIVKVPRTFTLPLPVGTGTFTTTVTEYPVVVVTESATETIVDSTSTTITLSVTSTLPAAPGFTAIRSVYPDTKRKRSDIDDVAEVAEVAEVAIRGRQVSKTPSGRLLARRQESLLCSPADTKCSSLSYPLQVSCVSTLVKTTATTITQTAQRTKTKTLPPSVTTSTRTITVNPIVIALPTKASTTISQTTTSSVTSTTTSTTTTTTTTTATLTEEIVVATVAAECLSDNTITTYQGGGISSLTWPLSAEVISRVPSAQRCCEYCQDPIRKCSGYAFDIDGRGICYLANANECDGAEKIPIAEFHIGSGIYTELGNGRCGQWAVTIW